MKAVLAGVTVVLCLAGCVGNKQGDEAKKANQFNKQSFERAMVESGKEKELKEAKERERKYLEAQGGVQDEQR